MKAHWIVIATSALAGCSGVQTPKPQSHSVPPAQVLQISDELELASVRLTAAAEKRLGVSVHKAGRQQLTKRRPYPAVAVVPPENVVLLLSPMTGKLTYQGPRPLAVGTSVSRGQPLFSFEPLLVENYALGPTQQESLRATRLSIQQSEAAILTRINNAKVEVEASQIDLRRAEQLFEQKVGSRKRVDDARARFQLAVEVLDSAQRELKVLQRVTVQAKQPPSPAPLSLLAPFDGTISKLQAVEGQSVTAGQPLLEITNFKRIWLRVRIPQSEAREIQTDKSATLTLAGRPLEARPTAGSPTADPLAPTIDRYYAVEAPGLNPDQRIEVSLPLRGSGQRLVVPTAAILYDVFGGSWVYIRARSQTYQRVRVQVDYCTEEGQAVLSTGPAPGAEVVTHGAAEIFGIEFGND